MYHYFDVTNCKKIIVGSCKSDRQTFIICKVKILENKLVFLQSFLPLRDRGVTILTSHWRQFVLQHSTCDPIIEVASQYMDNLFRSLGKVVNSVPYRLVWLEYIVLASNPVRSTPLFRTGKNTGRTGQFRAVPAGTEKSFFFFFLSFVIFEFLLGQNGNLLVLFVFLVCNGNF